MTPTLQKVLRQLSDLKFLTLDQSGFHYGPPGKLLVRNLDNFWFQQSIVKPRYNVFLTSPEKSAEALKFLRSTEVDSPPFGLAMMKQSKSKWNQWMLDLLESPGFPHQTARLIVFVEANEAKDFFHVRQRERKVWWRKLAWNPSRFTTTEIKKTKNLDVLDVQAEFEFGNVVVETVTCYHEIHKIVPQVGRKF